MPRLRRSLASPALLDACLKAGFQINPKLAGVVTCACGQPVPAADYEHHRRNLCPGAPHADSGGPQ